MVSKLLNTVEFDEMIESEKINKSDTILINKIPRALFTLNWGRIWE